MMEAMGGCWILGPHGPWLGSLVGKLWVDEKYHENDI